MKNKIISYLLVLVSVFMTTAFCACSDDDDEPVITGQEQVAQFKSVVNSYTVYSSDGITYCVVAKDSSEAKTICENIIGESWDGTAKTITYNDNYGTIKVMPSTEDGVFVEIALNLKDLKAATLKISTESYVQSENAHKYPTIIDDDDD
jgi:hypothetical protein